KGFLVVDNATSHANELAEFKKMIEEDEMFETVLLAFQNGAFVARKKK
ncbi:methyltransferase, partial [Bacillus cereus]